MSKHLFVKCTNVHLCSLAMVMLLLFLPSMAIKAASQSLTVSGVVTSATDKMPLIGVSVLVKGTTKRSDFSIFVYRFCYTRNCCCRSENIKC